MLPLGVIGLAPAGATVTVKFMPLHGPVPAGFQPVIHQL